MTETNAKPTTKREPTLAAIWEMRQCRWIKDCPGCAERLDQLEATLARYRTALVSIGVLTPRFHPVAGYMYDVSLDAIARAALDASPAE